MKRSTVFIVAILAISMLAFAQVNSPREAYYRFVQARDELLKKFPVGEEAGRKAFTEALNPYLAELKGVAEKANLDELREDDLFYCGIIAGFTSLEEKSAESFKLYLKRFPRGLFVSLASRELLKRLALMDRIQEAKELLPRIQADNLEAFYESLSYIAWGYQGKNDLAAALEIYQMILNETVRRSGFEPLPTYRIARLIPSMAEIMKKMGKEKEAEEIFQSALPKLSGSPEIQKQMATVIQGLEIIGKPAPEWNIDKWVNGDDQRLSELRGRVVLIDFWATWCGPCIAAFPYLKELQNKFKNRGLVIVGLTKYYGQYKNMRNLGKEEEVKKIEEDFVKEHALTWPLGIAEGDKLFQDYGVTGLPTVFVIDKKGVVRLKIIGHNEDNKSKLENMISLLLEEK
jgi:thiol-disulfide isomerase/thioredoxin